jgi:hypothetical protein
VNVDHARLPLPLVDVATCSLVFEQIDAPWRFDGGTGRFQDATGFGVFDLTGLVSFREIVKKEGDWGKPKVKCPLDYVSPGQARWSIEHNGEGLPEPVIFEFGVQATGKAAVREHRRPPEPCPTETINHFAPTSGPAAEPTVVATCLATG